MIIETKYNIEDEVYILDGFDILRTVVDKISVVCDSFNRITIGYELSAYKNNIHFCLSKTYSEDEVFETPNDVKNNIKFKK